MILLQHKNTMLSHLLKLPFLLLLSLMVLLSSCKKDDNNPPGNSLITADAGPDQTVNVDETVTPDGSSSTFNRSATTPGFLLKIIDSPLGGFSGIDNPFSLQTTFTPDLVGNYILVLTISLNGQCDSDTMHITALTSGSVKVVAPILEDRTWTGHLDSDTQPDYNIQATISVQAVLTIEPGVLLAKMLF